VEVGFYPQAGIKALRARKTLGAAVMAALNFFGAGFGTRKSQIWDRAEILSTKNLFHFNAI